VLLLQQLLLLLLNTSNNTAHGLYLFAPTNLSTTHQAIKIQQDQEDVGTIARADVAEICVSCLLDARACNLAFYASQSKYAPTAIRYVYYPVLYVYAYSSHNQCFS
jgi:hypothetical protein